MIPEIAFLEPADRSRDLRAPLRFATKKGQIMKAIPSLRILFGILCWSGFFFCSTAGATMYYVCPSGDDDNPGTREAPWRSATHAGERAAAGDTVWFLPGNYSDPLIPANSGTADAPIVFASKVSRQARLIGHNEGDLLAGEGGRVFLKEVAHVVLRGFQIVDTAGDSSAGGWLVADGVENVTVEDCRFFGGHRWYHFNIQNSGHIRILDSEFARSPESDDMRGCGDMWRIRNVRHMIVEGNSFSKALHTLVGFIDCEDIVIRGNVFHAGWARNLSTTGGRRILVENNIFTNSYNGSRSAGSMNQHIGNLVIQRHNQVFRNFGIPVVVTTRPPGNHTVQNRFYNNVFYGNAGWGLVVEGHRGNLRDMVLKNNIFAFNDPHTSGTQVFLTGGGSESVRFRANNFYSGAANNPELLLYATNPVGLAQVQDESSPAASSTALPAWMLETERIVGEWTADDNRDALVVASEPIPHALSYARDTGSGDRLPVRRIRAFLPPENTGMEIDDRIYAGTAKNVARVVKVDVESSELVLDRELTWERGAPVARLASPAEIDIFRGNFEEDPHFEAATDFNFALAENSPLRERGAWLTRTRGSGKGRELPVEDVSWFYDGFGITGETGDRIAVGESANRASIVAIRYEERILVLDRGLEWEAGDPVSFPWAGKGPSLGAFEYSEEARSNVRIVAENGVVRPGETVNLRAVARGLEPPLKYEWQLGDGTRAMGEMVSHRYDEADDYGIRVRVTDGQGRRAIGVGYVLVEEAKEKPDVLLHTTFDADDPDWWIHWQFYRGRIHAGYAGYERVLDEETGRGYHHNFPLNDNRPIPAFLFPRQWEVDRHPKVRICYRIAPGSPVAIFVRPFPSAHDARVFIREEQDFRQDSRRFYFAGTRAEPRGEQKLIDDGEWHEIAFDVREVREEFPDVNVLQALEIGDLDIDGGTTVGPGDEFWLDEIYIGK